MDFKKALKRVERYISGESDHIPGLSRPFEEEDPYIKEDLLEFNRRGILTLKSQPFYDGQGDLIDGHHLVQTPYVEGLCLKYMHDLMCSNADTYRYLYTTISM